AALDVEQHDQAARVPLRARRQGHRADRQLLAASVGMKGARVPLVVCDRDGIVLLHDGDVLGWRPRLAGQLLLPSAVVDALAREHRRARPAAARAGAASASAAPAGTAPLFAGGHPVVAEADLLRLLG